MNLLLLTLIVAMCVAALLMEKVRQQTNGATKRKVIHADAKDALDRIKDWATWLAGIQTGAMASIGFLKDSDLAARRDGTHRFFGTLSLLFFGISVFGFAWLLASPPSIQQRLVNPETPQQKSAENDIYHQLLFESGPPIKLEFASAFSHYFGIVGFVFSALFFAIGIVGEHRDKDPTVLTMKGLEKTIEIRLTPPAGTPPNHCDALDPHPTIPPVAL